MSDEPMVIRHQVHTVLLTASRRQGVALGVDANGTAFRIWLLTPRAVEVGLEKLKAVANTLGALPRRINAPQETIRGSRNQSLSRRSCEWTLR